MAKYMIPECTETKSWLPFCSRKTGEVLYTRRSFFITALSNDTMRSGTIGASSVLTAMKTLGAAVGLTKPIN